MCQRSFEGRYAGSALIVLSPCFCSQLCSMSAERRRLKRELDGLHEHCTTQVSKLEQLLEEDPD
eukprot:11593080-Karenia_brevis.AAC.1